jgi:predicted nuclease of restriction endonuclease-like (RecB) superfamily
MAKKRALRLDGYQTVLADVVRLLEAARRTAARTINTVITSTYWQIGRHIVEGELRGSKRADYGERLIDRLSADLTRRFGRGFSRRAVYQMRAFYLAYPQIVQSPSAQSREGRGRDRAIVQTAIAHSTAVDIARFSLPWSHYVRLLSIDDPGARRFYETEALRGGWTVKQLDRQIGTQFYERTMLSTDKRAMLTKRNRRRHQDDVSPEEEIKDPLVLEFLGLKDEYSESDIEEALVRHLESFLLELGGDFAFIGRQRRLRIGDSWYRIDLLFFHRRLRCLILIDLKTGRFTHADAGQMHLYCNYAAEHWTNPGENPPVGLILCAQKDAAVAHYALDGLPNKILAARYKVALPDEDLLAAELEKTRKMLETRLR